MATRWRWFPIVGLADRPRYQTVFPGARGILYWTVLWASFAAGLNSLFIALRRRWALWLNPLIGVISLALLEATRGPRGNELVVVAASFLVPSSGFAAARAATIQAARELYPSNAAVEAAVAQAWTAVGVK